MTPIKKPTRVDVAPKPVVTPAPKPAPAPVPKASPVSNLPLVTMAKAAMDSATKGVSPIKGVVAAAKPNFQQADDLAYLNKAKSIMSTPISAVARQVINGVAPKPANVAVPPAYPPDIQKPFKGEIVDPDFGPRGIGIETPAPADTSYKGKPNFSSRDDAIKAATSMANPAMNSFSSMNPSSAIGSASTSTNANYMKKGGAAKKYTKGGKINLDACGVSTHKKSKSSSSW